MNPIRVFIGETGAIRRATCERLMAGAADISLLGHADGPLEILAAVARHRPDVLVMGAADGDARVVKEVVSAIRRSWPSTHTLLLSSRDATEDWMVEMVLCGARGLLCSDCLSRQLLRSLRLVSSGELWISRRLPARFLDLALQ